MTRQAWEAEPQEMKVKWRLPDNPKLPDNLSLSFNLTQQITLRFQCGELLRHKSSGEALRPLTRETWKAAKITALTSVVQISLLSSAAVMAHLKLKDLTVNYYFCVTIQPPEDCVICSPNGAKRPSSVIRRST